jgi:hypothetical protein
MIRRWAIAVAGRSSTKGAGRLLGRMMIRSGSASFDGEEEMIMHKDLMAPALAALLAAGVATIALVPAADAAGQHGSQASSGSQSGQQGSQPNTAEGQKDSAVANAQSGQQSNQSNTAEGQKDSAVANRQSGQQGNPTTNAQVQQANQAAGVQGVQGAQGQANSGWQPGSQGQSYGRAGQTPGSETGPTHLVVTEDRVRQQLQVTRQALQQGDPRQAEQALDQLDAMVTPAQNPHLQQAIDNARQALARNDTASAEAALQQVSETDLNPQVDRGRHG